MSKQLTSAEMRTAYLALARLADVIGLTDEQDALLGRLIEMGYGSILTMERSSPTEGSDS